MRNKFIIMIITVFAIVTVLLSLASCRNEMSPIHDKAGPIRITVTAEAEPEKATTITGSAPDIADLYWTYTATKMDDGLALGEQRAPVYAGRIPFSIDLSAGGWQIYTRGYRDEACREMVYSGFVTKTFTGADSVTITVTVCTIESQVSALNSSDTAKKTADIVLRPVVIDRDPTGLAVRHMKLVIANKNIASWSLSDNIWIDDADGATVPEEGIIYEAPIGTGKTISLIVTEEDGSLVAGEGWRKVSLAANCTYIVQGTVTAVPGESTVNISITGPGEPQTAKRTAIIRSVFDVIPSGAPNYAFLYAWADSDGNQLSFPFTTFVDGEWHAGPYSPEELGLQPLTATDGFGLNATEAWVGTSASSNNSASSNYNQKLRKARFATGLTETHKAALSGYTKLAEVTVPEGIVTLSDYTFHACPMLTDVVLPEGLTTIGKGVFKNCSALETLELPTTVTAIGEEIFSGCTKLKTVTLPEGISKFPNYAFQNCATLENIVIPSTVTSIGYYVFSGCSSLKSAVIPSGVTSMETCLFSGCSALTDVTIPNTVTSISNAVFQNCTSLTSVTIPASVRSCQTRAFAGCTALENVTLNNGITLLGSEMFSGCTSLKTITIPNSVTSVGNGIFSGCTALETVYVENYRGIIDFSNTGAPDSTQILFLGEY